MEILMLSIQIFLVRILDVSLGTFRTIVVVKGKTILASIIGFIEILIWFLIVKTALNTEASSLWVAISYSGGFAIGTLIGGYLSKKFIKGSLTIQIITDVTDKLVHMLRSEGYGVSVIDIKGKDETKDKHMLFMEIENKYLSHLKSTVKMIDNNAFLVVHETKYVQNGFIKI